MNAGMWSVKKQDGEEFMTSPSSPDEFSFSPVSLSLIYFTLWCLLHPRNPFVLNFLAGVSMTYRIFMRQEKCSFWSRKWIYGHISQWAHQTQEVSYHIDAMHFYFFMVELFCHLQWATHKNEDICVLCKKCKDIIN